MARSTTSTDNTKSSSSHKSRQLGTFFLDSLLALSFLLLSIFVIYYCTLPNPPPTSLPKMPGTSYTQHALTLPSLGRGSHLITDHITSSLPEISSVKCGLLHLFLQHTSCALSMNENWDSDVRADMSDALDGIVVEDKGTPSCLANG